MRSLIEFCAATEIREEERLQECGVHDECRASGDCMNPYCDGCEPGQGPVGGGCYWPEWAGESCSEFWSSSLDRDAPGTAWIVDFNRGMVGSRLRLGGAHVRCVRDQ